MRGVGLVGHGETVRGAHPTAVTALGGHRIAGVAHGENVGSPASRPFTGVITRSSPAVVKAVWCSSTSTEWTVPWAKSRLIRSRSVVVRASILVVAWSGVSFVPE
ncbi:hypothetical protein SHIRM173S_10181 [Streptomyces hirsutus]